MVGKKTKLTVILGFLLMFLLATGTAFATTIGPGALPSWTGSATWSAIDSSYSSTSYASGWIASPIAGQSVDIYFTFVYDRVVLASGLRFDMNVDWDTAVGYSNFANGEDWFDASENQTWSQGEAEYGRAWYSLTIDGNVDSFMIDFFTLNGNGNITEYYVFAKENAAPVPEPATMLLLGSGMVGLAGLRRKKKT